MTTKQTITFDIQIDNDKIILKNDRNTQELNGETEDDLQKVTTFFSGLLLKDLYKKYSEMQANNNSLEKILASITDQNEQKLFLKLLFRNVNSKLRAPTRYERFRSSRDYIKETIDIMFSNTQEFIDIYKDLLEPSNMRQLTDADDGKLTADFIDEAIDKYYEAKLKANTADTILTRTTAKKNSLQDFLNISALQKNIPDNKEIKEIKKSLKKSPTELDNKLKYEGGNNSTQKNHKINNNKTAKKNK